MKSSANTVDEYLGALPEDRKSVLGKLRKILKQNLPKGFKEQMSYGSIGYVIPHSIYPPGYHCSPELPLPFIGLASQKNFVALYHMGIYADKKLLDWFTSEYVRVVGTKPDMGKSCIRFKKPEKIPFELIAELAAKISPEVWIKAYEKAFIK